MVRQLCTNKAPEVNEQTNQVEKQTNEKKKCQGDERKHGKLKRKEPNGGLEYLEKYSELLENGFGSQGGLRCLGQKKRG